MSRTRFPQAARVKGRKLVEAQPTTVGGITFDSKLNATFYTWCRVFGVRCVPADGQPDPYKVVIMPQFRFPNGTKAGELCKAITWTPDFTDPDLRWVAEGKGYANEKFTNTLKLAKHQWMQLEKPPRFFIFKTPEEAKALAYKLSQLYPKPRS